MLKAAAGEDGMLSYEEIVQLIDEVSEPFPQEQYDWLLQTFAMADTDGDGAASYNELYEAMGPEAMDSEYGTLMTEMFSWADAVYGNHDDKFTADEVFDGMNGFQQWIAQANADDVMMLDANQDQMVGMDELDMVLGGICNWGEEPDYDDFEESGECKCYANGWENEEFCQSGNLDVIECVNDDRCHWGPGENEECEVANWDHEHPAGFDYCGVK